MADVDVDYCKCILFSLVDKPAKVSVHLKDARCVENEPVSLVAEFDRKVSINSVKWFFNNEEITSTDREYSVITDGATCTLKLFNPTPDTTGQYTISVDGVTSSATLTVTRKELLY